MIKYCSNNSLFINSAKTKLLLSSRDNFDITVRDSIVYGDIKICLLGIDYDKNFSTLPYLRKLATDAKSTSAVNYRLSFEVPQNLLRPLENGLVIVKILAAAPAAIPFKIEYDDMLLIWLQTTFTLAKCDLPNANFGLFIPLAQYWLFLPQK